MELKKLQALSESKFSKVGHVTVFDLILNKNDKKLILDLAHMMLSKELFNNSACRRKRNY